MAKHSPSPCQNGRDPHGRNGNNILVSSTVRICDVYASEKND
jgi:hypothetical protein